MGMARVIGVPLGGVVLAASSLALAQSPPVSLVVDNDDDNNDRVADCREPGNVDPTDSFSSPADQFPSGSSLRRISPDPSGLRVIVDGHPIAMGAAIPRSAKRIAVQAINPGSYVVDFGTVQKQFSAIQIIAIDGAGKPVDFSASHASFQRTPPDRLDSPTQITNDPDALRFVVAGPADALPPRLRIVSRSETGAEIDVLPMVAISDVPCPSGLPASVVCKSSFPIRVVVDAVDQRIRSSRIDRSVLFSPVGFSSTLGLDGRNRFVSAALASLAWAPCSASAAKSASTFCASAPAVIPQLVPTIEALWPLAASKSPSPILCGPSAA